MFGIALLPLLWQTLAKMAFSLLVTTAQKAGVINKIEATAIRTEHDVVSAVESLKTYPEYPTGKNGQTEEQPPTQNNVSRNAADA